MRCQSYTNCPIRDLGRSAPICENCGEVSLNSPEKRVCQKCHNYEIQEKAAAKVAPTRASEVKHMTLKETGGFSKVESHGVRRVAPKPKPSAPQRAKPKPPRPEISPIVKSLKKDVSLVDEPMKNYVGVEDQMIAFDLLHVSGDEDKNLQVSCEEEGLGIKWNDLPATASSLMQKLFTVDDQVNATIVCLRIML